MSSRKAMAEKRVDAFVTAVNSAVRYDWPVDSVPELCRLPGDDWCPWRIVPSSGADWLPALEARLPVRFPLTFTALVSRYLFPAFGCGSIQFYGVGVTGPDAEFEELRLAMLQNPALDGFLCQHGLLPFARTEEGLYDRICFDFRNGSSSDEPPVVQIDHEEVLIHERIHLVRTLSPASHLLIEEMTANPVISEPW